MMKATLCTVEAVPFLRRELSNISIATNARKPVALRLKGHVSTPKELTLLEGIGVRIAERGGVKVVGVPTATDAFAMESALI